MIEDNGFALTRMAPRLTKEKIDHIAKVDRGEKFAAAFTDSEMIERVNNEVACLKRLQLVAVLTGSYLTIPVSCQVLNIPMVWAIQSDLASGFLPPRRRDDRPNPPEVPQSPGRLVPDDVHQLLDQARIP